MRERLRRHRFVPPVLRLRSTFLYQWLLKCTVAQPDRLQLPARMGLVCCEKERFKFPTSDSRFTGASGIGRLARPVPHRDAESGTYHLERATF